MPPLQVTVMVKQGKVVQMGRWGWGRQVCGSRSKLCGMEQSMYYAIIQPRAGVSGPLWHGLGLSRLEPHVLLHQAKKAHLPCEGALAAEWGYSHPLDLSVPLGLKPTPSLVLGPPSQDVR